MSNQLPPSWLLFDGLLDWDFFLCGGLWFEFADLLPAGFDLGDVDSGLAFMESAILFLSRSISVTVTWTFWPTLTTSAGSWMKWSASCEMWTSPSWWTPTSTKAPKLVTLVTMPGSFIPVIRSDGLSIPSAKLNSSNCFLGSRPGLDSSAKMSLSVGSPTSSET